MAKSYALMTARLRTLLETTAGLSRPLDTAIPAKTFWEEASPEGSPTHYLLWPLGDNDAGDVITGTPIRRIQRFELTLSSFCGGGDASDGDEVTVADSLMTLWGRVVLVLGDPNNRNYSTTGMIYAHKFAAGSPVKVKDGRLELRGTFEVIYDQDAAAM